MPDSLCDAPRKDPAIQPDQLPSGKTFTFSFNSTGLFPGTVRNIHVYVPAQYKAERPACLCLGLDGLCFNMAAAFDRLLLAGEIPVIIAIGIEPGRVDTAQLGGKPRYSRSLEFDGMSGDLARFILEEVIPAVEAKTTPGGLPILLSQDPNDRCVCGLSTGGIGSFTLAWERPDAFRRVFSAIGTFVAMRGGDHYPNLIRKTEPKPLRIFLQDGSEDQCIGEIGDWWLANLTMERALAFAGYDLNHLWTSCGHNPADATAYFPDIMRWLWRDWPAPVQAGTSKNGFVSDIVSKDEPWRQVALDFAAPTALAPLPNGDTLVIQDGSTTIAVIGSDGTSQAGIELGMKVRAIAAGADGRLCAADAEKPEIVLFDAERRQISTIPISFQADTLLLRHNSDLYAADSAAGELWLLKPDGTTRLLDSGIYTPSGLAVSPDGNWLSVVENKTHRGYSYKLLPDGSVDFKQRFHWFHVPDWADSSGARTCAMDVDGRMYAATAMGIQVFDHNGRARGILPLPIPTGAASSLCFAGADFQHILALADGKIFQRKTKVKGLPLWSEPAAMPAWGAG